MASERTVIEWAKREAKKPNGKKVFGIILKDPGNEIHRYLICVKEQDLKNKIKKLLGKHSGSAFGRWYGKLIEIIEFILIQRPLKYHSDDPPDEYWIKKSLSFDPNDYDLEW